MFDTKLFDLRPKADPKAVVQGKHYRFTVLTERLIRMEWDETDAFQDRATQKVICREFPVPEFTVRETEDSLEIITAKLHLYYNKQAFTFAGLSVAVAGLKKHKCAKWHFGMAQPYLAGVNTNRGGTCSTLDMVDGACALEPGIIDRQGFATLDDSDTMALDENGWYAPAERPGCKDLYFFGYLEEQTDCLRDFFRLTGMTPMLPRYALGNWWSRYYPYTEETYRALMEKFREKKVPLSVSVLDMDWHITKPDPKYGNGWTGNTWDKTKFPDPERLLRWLHDSGLKVTLNLHPCDGIRAFEDCYRDAAEAMGIDPESEEPVQCDLADPKFMHVYLDKVLHPLEEQGVDFWWIDWQQQGGYSKDGYDPLWMLNHYLYTDNARKGEYPLTLSRYAGPGSHRYPLGFSGDTIMSWASLDFQPYFTNTAANIGYGWWSHDIGGHKAGVWDDDLQIRWVQYGVFSPIMRLHSSKDPFLLKEPWNYPIGTELILEKFLRLRHALVPYLYTMNYRCHTEGKPLCLPLYYAFAKKMTHSNGFRNEYTFGSELLVCPITTPTGRRSGTGCVGAWIPDGTWFDFFTGRRYTGEKQMNLYRTQEDYPVLAKAGAIIPLADDGCQNGTPLPKALRVRVFAGADGAFDLYEDDGKIADTKRAITPLRFDWGGTCAFMKLPVDGLCEIPDRRTYRLELVGAEKPESVTALVDGRAVDAAWEYCDETHTLLLGGIEAGRAETLEVRVQTSGKPAETDFRQEIVRRLPRWQIENPVKGRIMAALNLARGNERRLLGMLPRLVGNEPDILGELTEILTSAD